jgi:hypothetical protein
LVSPSPVSQHYHWSSFQSNELPTPVNDASPNLDTIINSIPKSN